MRTLPVGPIRRRRLVRFGTLFAPAVLVAACGPQGAGTGGGPGAAKKEYVVAPPQGAFGGLANDLKYSKPMQDLLAKETGLPVRVFPPGDYTRSLAGLTEGTLDFSFLPALLYLRAHDDGGAQPLFRTLRPGVDGKPTAGFTSIIAVRADSGINALADLKGKHIAAVDAIDGAGWVMPAAYLKKSGIDPNRDVTVQYRKDGPDALVQVLNKKSDAAFAAKRDLSSASVLKADPNAAQALKLLWHVDGVPLDVVGYRKGLDPKVVEKFKAAFLTLGDPQKAATTGSDGKPVPILAQWGISGLAEVKDADLAALRDAGKTIGVKLK